MRFEEGCEKRISYVLVTRNRAEYVRSTLTWLRDLVEEEDELIVVDGGSTDHTAEVVGQYDDLVDLFLSEPDLGEGHAANKGYLLSRGRYVKELTDDDIIHPEAMREALRVMDEHPEIDLLVCGGTKRFGEQTKVVWLPPGTGFGSSVDDPLRYGCCGIGWVIRKSIFAKVGMMNPQAISLDVDFTSQAISRGAVVRFCRINLYHHEVLPHSTTIAQERTVEREFNRISRTYGSTRYYLRRWLTSKTHRRRGILSGTRRLVERALGTRKPKDEPEFWDAGFS